LNQDTARLVFQTLQETYGSPNLNNKRNPLSELFFVVISQKTGNWTYEAAYKALRHSFPSWGLIRDAPFEDVALPLKRAGLSNNKAARIKAIADRLYRDFGRVTLAPLKAMTDEEAEAYLTSLPGVGEKTAKCVLMYALHRSVLPVDTHVKRVATRLGILEPRVSDHLAHTMLAEKVPPPFRYDFHVNAVLHGRRVCTTNHPACDKCPVAMWCQYPMKANRGGDGLPSKAPKVRVGAGAKRRGGCQIGQAR
jgi:endonuclease-3